MTTPLLHPFADVASSLGVSVRKVEQLVAQGELAAVRLGGKRMVEHGELMTFVEKLRNGTREKV